MIQTPYLSKEIQDAKSEVDVAHRRCECSFDAIRAESDFYDANQKILDWVSDAKHEIFHRVLIRSSKVGDSYSLCGEWLLESEEYSDWNTRPGVQVLWIVGTGIVDPIQPHECTVLILASWHGQVDFVVSNPMRNNSITKVVSDAESLKSFGAFLQRPTTRALLMYTAHASLMVGSETQRQSFFLLFANLRRSKVGGRSWSPLTRSIGSTVAGCQRLLASYLKSRMNYSKAS
jgi:hypothetical protein